jgi:hypothetical protein
MRERDGEKRGKGRHRKTDLIGGAGLGELAIATLWRTPIRISAAPRS